MKRKRPPETISAGLKRLGYKFRLCWDLRWKLWYMHPKYDRMDYYTGKTALGTVRNACKVEGV